MGELQQERDRRSDPAAHGHAAHQAAEVGGELATRRLLAFGHPQPRQVARILLQFPDDRLAIIALLHRTLGNGFASEVLSILPELEAGADAGKAPDPLVTMAETPISSAPPQGVAPVAAPDQDVADLRAWKPTQTGGDRGYAAWLLRARQLGFLSATGRSLPELGDFVAGRMIHSPNEQPLSQDDEDAGRKAGGHKLDKVHRTPTGYDVDLKEAPILATIVTILSARIGEWATNGGGKRRPLLRLGDFVRGDVGFGAKSPHNEGVAIDLDFVGQKNSAQDVIDILRVLPPGRLEVFSDNNDALHLDRRPGGFGLGLPSKGDYLSSRHAINPDRPWRNAEQDRVEREAGDDHGKTLHANGLVLYKGTATASATWDARRSRWEWSKWVLTGDSVEPYLVSPVLHAAIADYRARSAAARKP